MSILIKGMVMSTLFDEFCILDKVCGKCSGIVNERPKDCPLIEIPTPHGRLIEEHYSGELKAKHAEGIYIIYRSADEDTDRFILEEEK